MAKTVQLNVQVKDDQFKQFQKNFNDFTDQIKGLMGQFKQVQTSVDDVAKDVRTLTQRLSDMMSISRTFRTNITGITTEFGKWATLISGVVTALGTGAGLYGLDKLANTIVQQRRRMMMLGGDQAATQAAVRGAGVISDKPEDIIKNVRMGLGGSEAQMRGLMSAGLYQPGRKPEDVMKDLIRRMPDLLRQAPKGQEVPYAESMGYTSLLSQEEIMRLIPGQGGRRRVAEMEEQWRKQPAEMSKPAQEAWSNLSQAWNNFRDNFINRMGEDLADFAKWLTKVTEGFTDLINTLHRVGVVKTVLETWEKWSKSFSEWLKKETLKEAIEKFAAKFKETLVGPLEMFKGFMDQLNAKMGELISNIASLLRSTFWSIIQKLTGAGGDGGAAAPGSLSQQLGANDINTAPGTTTAPGDGKAPSDQKSAPGASAPGAPISSEAPTETGRTTTFQQAITHAGGGPLYAVPTPGGPGSPTGAAGISGAINRSMRSSMNLMGGNSNQFAAFGGAGGAGGNVSFGGNTQFASAVNNRAPGRSNWAMSVANHLASNNNFTFGGAGGRRGPLDSDNWQQNRTATLRIDNTAGSNPYMSAQGMSMS